MTNTIDTAAAKSIHTFAWMRGEWGFAHMVTAALAGEQWATDRVALVVDSYIDGVFADRPELLLAAIHATDTTRPDGAIARSVQP
jgi:hypothetical protein